MHAQQARLLIFAKAPVPGAVKTRLLPVLGIDQAAQLYAGLLSSLLERIAPARLAQIECWCAPDAEHPLFQQLATKYGLRLEVQQGSDLGARMAYAADQALGRADSVVLLGGDCPPLRAGHLRQSLDWLDGAADAVLGPAEDGGYVLLGLTDTHPRLFDAIDWGGGDVLETTRARLRELGWTWRELETLWDLDRPEDLERYRNYLT